MPIDFAGEVARAAASSTWLASLGASADPAEPVLPSPVAGGETGSSFDGLGPLEHAVNVATAMHNHRIAEL